MRVLVVGDIRLFCDGLAHYLRRVPGVTMAGRANTTADAVRKCRRSKADVVLIDMAMPDGMAAVREIGAAAPEARIVGVSVPNEGKAVIECAEAGVSAYVAREGSLDDLAATLECVMRDEALVSPRIAGALLRRLGDRALGRNTTTDASTSTLTGREEEIAGLIQDGLSNKQIARRLRIRVPTVKNHVHHILEKLAVSRRTEIAGRLGGRSRANAPDPEWSRGRTGSRAGSDMNRKAHAAARPGDASSG